PRADAPARGHGRRRRHARRSGHDGRPAPPPAQRRRERRRRLRRQVLKNGGRTPFLHTIPTRRKTTSTAARTATPSATTASRRLELEAGPTAGSSDRAPVAAAPGGSAAGCGW